MMQSAQVGGLNLMGLAVPIYFSLFELGVKKLFYRGTNIPLSTLL